MGYDCNIDQRGTTAYLPAYDSFEILETDVSQKWPLEASQAQAMP